MLLPLTSRAASSRAPADRIRGQEERPLSHKSLICPAGGAEIPRCLRRIGRGVNHAFGSARRPRCPSGVRSRERAARGLVDGGEGHRTDSSVVSAVRLPKTKLHGSFSWAQWWRVTRVPGPEVGTEARFTERRGTVKTSSLSLPVDSRVLAAFRGGRSPGCCSHSFRGLRPSQIGCSPPHVEAVSVITDADVRSQS